MEKTKIGLSVALMSALVYLVALFGGYTPLLLVAAYVLLVENNDQLKKTAVTALGILIAFSAVNFIIYLLPDLLGILYSFLEIFNVYFRLSFVSSIANFLSTGVSFVKDLALILLAVMAGMNKPIKLSFLDKLFD